MGSATWTFLTNHGHVLACLHRDPNVTVREVATRVGITERAVLHIIRDLEDAKVVTRERIGRHNRYAIRLDATLRHPLLSGARVLDLIELIEIGAGQNRVTAR